MTEDVFLAQLAGWRTGTLSDTSVFLDIEYLPDEAAVRAWRTLTLRLAMKRTLASEFAEAIRRMAIAPHVLPPKRPH